MSDDINRIMKCLTLSVQENEIKNLESLSWAINKLENFSMTFDMLDRSRIGQTLQSVRHSKKISSDISERIRYLIKCWRRLLDVNCISVIPNEIRNSFFSSLKSSSKINGVTNGFIKESITSNFNNLNGINHASTVDLDKSEICEKPKVENDVKESYPNNGEHMKTEIISEKLVETNQLSDETLTKSLIVNASSINEPSPMKEKETHIEIITEKISNENLCIAQISENCVVENVCSNNTNQCLNQKQISSEIETDIEIISEKNQNFDSVPATLFFENCNSNDRLNQENISQEVSQSHLSNTIDENTALNNESKNGARTQLGKPKLKSTKELLADFSNLIDSDTKNKILMDKITQEDDDPASYHPDEFKLREIIQQRNLFQEKYLVKEILEKEEEIESDDQSEKIIEVKKETKCDKLLKKFQAICGIQPKVIFRPMVPWKNLKRGIDCSSPHIKQSKSAMKRNINPDESINLGEPQNKYSVSYIDDLLQTFEMRSQRKDMITTAILQRKEIQVVDNTQSIVDLSLKLKLKIPQQKLQILKIKKRKRKKKKKKPKPKPIQKPLIKKPRKPRVKPKPPVTNYLDDLPKLPELTETLVTIIEEELSENQKNFLCSEENLQKFTYEVVEGYNCTKHTQTSEILEYTKMYSLLIDKTYLHVFPWVDLEYPVKSTFSSESDEIIKSALDLPQLFS